MAVAEVLDPAVSVRCRLLVDGLVSYDEQTTSLPVECLYIWSCTYTGSPILMCHRRMTVSASSLVGLI